MTWTEFWDLLYLSMTCCMVSVAKKRALAKVICVLADCAEQTRRKSNGAESRRRNSRTGSNDKITTPNPGGIQLSVTVLEHGGILFE